MKFSHKFIAKNGKEVYIRNGTASDGGALLENFNITHAETDYQRSYPDENQSDSEQESRFLERKEESPNEIELIALVDGKIVANAGIDAIGRYHKVAHRADFGISVLKEYWGLGIGHALLEICIRCAKDAGYTQLELEVVADNARAVSLYKKAGFVAYGRNPEGFLSRTAGYQEVVSMRLEL